MGLFLIPLDILRASPVLSYSSFKGECKIGVAYFINCDMSLFCGYYIVRTIILRCFIIIVFQILS